MKINKNRSYFAIFTLLLCAVVFASPAFGQSSNRSDDLIPQECAEIGVPSGNRLTTRVYAIGVQIYRWNGVNWDFVAPDADLYPNSKFLLKIGKHYAGPVWESSTGSRVLGRKVASCVQDPTAVPWLLLEGAATEGHGIFSDISFIQRVNTSGGQPPCVPGTEIGAEARIPYTATYNFFRSVN